MAEVGRKWDPEWNGSSRSVVIASGRGLSLRALAERHGVHRRTVWAALESPLPPAKRAPVSRPAPKLGAYRELIDEWLIADLEAPRKQRHTSKRIWRRLVDEHGAQVAETTVRDHVRKRRRELGHAAGDVLVPQVNAPGITAEVDFRPRRPSSPTRRATKRAVASRASFDGETRTLTGDTTIFRESQFGGTAHERPAIQAIPGRAVSLRCRRFRSVTCPFGTPRVPRSPNGLRRPPERSCQSSRRAAIGSR
jgi:hypothetical protein